MLRCGIGGDVAVTDFRRRRSDVDNSAPLRLKHCRQKRFAAIVGAGKIGGQGVIPLPIGHFRKTCRPGNAGIIDKNSYRTPALLDFLRQRLYLNSLSYVISDCENLAAISSNSVRHGLQFFAASRGDHDTIALAGKAAGERRAEPPTRARNENYFAGPSIPRLTLSYSKTYRGFPIP